MSRTFFLMIAACSSLVSVGASAHRAVWDKCSEGDVPGNPAQQERNRANNLQNQLNQCNGRANGLQGQVNSLSQQLTGERNRANGLQNQVNALNGQLNQMKSQMAQLTAAKAALEGRVGQLTGQVSGLTKAQADQAAAAARRKEERKKAVEGAKGLIGETQKLFDEKVKELQEDLAAATASADNLIKAFRGLEEVPATARTAFIKAANGFKLQFEKATKVVQEAVPVVTSALDPSDEGAAKAFAAIVKQRNLQIEKIREILEKGPTKAADDLRVEASLAEAGIEGAVAPFNEAKTVLFRLSQRAERLLLAIHELVSARAQARIKSELLAAFVKSAKNSGGWLKQVVKEVVKFQKAAAGE